MRYDCLMDKMIDEALDHLEREGKTLPEYRYTAEWNGTEWVYKSVKIN